MSSQPQLQTQLVQNNAGTEDILTFQSSNSLSSSQSTSQNDSSQQSVELKKGLKKLQQVWTEKNSNLENLIELARKASRNIHNYLGSIESETEVFSKNVLKNTKNLMGQINWQSGRDFLKVTNSFAGALQELAQRTQEMSQTNITTIQKSLGDYAEQIAQQKKQVQERSSNTVKNISNLSDKFIKQYSRYVKASKEVESSIQEQKNSQIDIRLYYNVAYTAKQDLKIKELAKEAQKEESKVRLIIEEGNQQIESLPQQIQDIYRSVKEVFKQTLQRIIDSVIAIHGQQFTLLSSFNQYILEKNLTQDTSVIEEDDQKIIQERIFKKNPDVIPPGVNFVPIQTALQRKEDVSENQMRAYPEAAFQYLEVFEQILQERRELMKNIKDFMSDLADQYGNLYGAIESQSKDIKKALGNTKGDSIVDLIYAILKEMIDQQQKQIDHLKTAFSLIKGSVKIIATCITDQQSQSNGFFNMTKKLFSDFNKASDKRKWVSETSSFLGISLDSFKAHEQKRLMQIREQMIKIIKEISFYLENQIKESKSQQTELIQRREGLDEEIHQVFITHNKLYENVVLNSEGVSFDYQKQFSISSEMQKQLDEINSKLYIYSQIDQIASSLQPNQSLEKNVSSVSGENSPQKSRNGSGESQNSSQKDENGQGKKEQTKFSILFGVGENDQPIDSFNCAFSHKILLQGKMHLFSDRIGFHSYFNSQSFVGDTTLSIPYTDIQKIEKRKNALIFDNSIAIITSGGELFFTSFVQRDNCFKLFTFLMQTVREGRSGSSILPNSLKKSAIEAINGEPTEDNRKLSELSSSSSSQPSSFPQTNPFNIQANEIRKSISEIVQETLNEPITAGSIRERPASDRLAGLDVSEFIGSNQGTGEKGSLSASRPESPKNASSSNRVSPQLQPAMIDIPAQEDMSWVEERRKKQKATSIFANAEKVSTFDMSLPNVTPREVFNILFSNKPFKPSPEGTQQYSNFRYYMMQEFQKDTDISFESFTPSPPEWYDNLDCNDRNTVKTSEDISSLNFKVVHPVREKIPFGPKVSHCANKEKYFWISADEFVIEKEITLSKIPYSDYFSIRFQYNITQSGDVSSSSLSAATQLSTQIQIKLYVNFFKSTTFKGRIENGTLTENNEVINQIFIPQSQIAMQNYIKYEKAQRIQRALQQQEQQQLLQSPSTSQILEQQQQQSQQQQLLLIQQETNKWIEERRKRFLTQSIFANVEKVTEFELTVPDVHPREVFNIIFLDNPFKTIEGDKTYPHFLHYFMQEFQKDTDMHFGKFSPPPPEWYSNLDSTDSKSIQNFEDYSLHEYKYVHPVREKIPFGPKVSHCENKEKYYWISADEFIMEKEVFLSKIPYCDYFTVRIQYIFTKNEQSGTKIICKLYVNFIKSTTFKGRIESGTLSENTDVWKNSFSPQILLVISNYTKLFAEKRKERAELLIQQQSQQKQASSSSYGVLKAELQPVQSIVPQRKSKRDILTDQQNQISSLYKLNEERFKQFNKKVNELQGIIDHQNSQFKNILIVIILVLIINLIHLFK